MRRTLLLIIALLTFASTAVAAPKDRMERGERSPYAKCDDFDPAVCLQPFPNNLFTKPSPDTDTGLKVAFDLTSMPRNAAGKPIQPAQWNRNDGFSPGSLITTLVPGLSLDRTKGVPIDDLDAFDDEDAAIVVINARTRERHEIWTEIDANDGAAPNLIIRPAKNFDEGETYIVALRGMKRADGSTIPAGDAFRGYRDRATKDGRTEHMEWIFRQLKKSGIGRKNLFLAWDFTVASERNLSERMLKIRDTAFEQLGDENLADMLVTGRAPEFKVSKVEQGGGIARTVTGYFKVPCFIATPNCEPGGGFVYRRGTNEPLQLPGNTYTGKFVCKIPQSALDAPGTATASLYGHGLFGSTGEMGQGQLRDFANEQNFVFCGTTWAGMGCELDTPPQDPQQWLADIQAGGTDTPKNCDIPNVLTAIGDLSRFNTMIDRVQQGMLAFLYLGRLMAHPQGLVSDPAFQAAGGAPAFRTGRTYYDGNSQGGIIGGSLAAVMVDGDRASLGVPGMNYSTLLQRSTDFGRGTDDECTRVLSGDLPSYACLVYKAYPSTADRQVVFGLMQMLWDRGEANGYAHHMTDDPLPNTPPHEILLSLAFGDHQVTNWAAAVEARTVGARLMGPALSDAVRGPKADYRYFGRIPYIDAYPYAGSAITVWDSGPIRDNCAKGTAAPLLQNEPVFDKCTGTPADEQGGNDPHEHPRRMPNNRAMKAAFLADGGRVTNHCGLGPCYADGFNGTP